MTPSTLYHPRPERWPQFSLRGLLVVVTLAALLMPWAAAEYRVWQTARQCVRGATDIDDMLDDSATREMLIESFGKGGLITIVPSVSDSAQQIEEVRQRVTALFPEAQVGVSKERRP
jgi:hypothetical protein